MSTQVVVVGSGYAGAGAVKAFEDEVGEGEADLTWISEHDYHLVLHEVHRAIRNPAVAEKITIPVDEIKSPESNFVRGRVVDVDTNEQVVETDDGTTVDYDYLLLGVGSTTAFFGDRGTSKRTPTNSRASPTRRRSTRTSGRLPPRRPARTPSRSSSAAPGSPASRPRAKSRSTAINTARPSISSSSRDSTRSSRATIPSFRARSASGSKTPTSKYSPAYFISKADEDAVYFGGGEDEEPEELSYDVLIWTGGITGQPELENVEVEKDERSNRVHAGSDFTTSDDRVFAIGDTALVEQGDDDVAPPTAQAAWQAAEVAGENLARAARGAPLQSWEHTDKGTVVSVGEDAVAHDVMGMPIKTFGGTPAKLLKKSIAVRWIAKISSTGRGVSAFGDM